MQIKTKSIQFVKVHPMNITTKLCLIGQAALEKKIKMWKVYLMVMQTSLVMLTMKEALLPNPSY